MKEQELQTVFHYINSFFPILTNIPAFVWKNMNSVDKRTIIQKNHKIIYKLISTEKRQSEEWYMELLDCFEWRKVYKEMKDDNDSEFNRNLLGDFLIEVVLEDMNNRNKLFN